MKPKNPGRPAKGVDETLHELSQKKKKTSKKGSRKAVYKASESGAQDSFLSRCPSKLISCTRNKITKNILCF